MTLLSAMNSAVSGMNAQAARLGSISNNIANSSTVGYKKSETEFESMVLDGTANGAENLSGVITQARMSIAIGGQTTTTGVSTDVAVNGNGMLVVSDTAAAGGKPLATRAGSFRPDSAGNMVNAGGYFLQGIPLDSSGNQISASDQSVENLSTVNVSYLSATAAPTTTMKFAANLSDVSGTAAVTAANIVTAAPGAAAAAAAIVVASGPADDAVTDTAAAVTAAAVTPRSTVQDTAIQGTTAAALTAANTLATDTAAAALLAVPAAATTAAAASAAAASAAALALAADTAATAAIAANSATATNAAKAAIAAAAAAAVTAQTAAAAANASAIAANTAAPANAAAAITAGTATTTETYFDALGNAQALKLTFTPSGATANTWTLSVTDTGTPNASGNPSVVASATLLFNGKTDTNPGTLQSVTDITGTGYDPSTGILTVPTIRGSGSPIALSIGAPNSSDGMQQLAGDYTITQVAKNGSSFGLLQGVSIDNTGKVIAAFSNGSQRAIYQLKIAVFANTDGLNPVSGGAYEMSPGAGVPRLFNPGTGPAGATQGGALEASNVDLPTELTNLIATQRAYSSSGTVVQAANQMMQEVNQLNR